MSLHEFWIGVRTGARLLAPRATVDSPKLDASAIERLLQGATLWLTPSVVAGFNEADFTFLPEVERTKLTRLVNAFRGVAAQVPPAAPASDEQIEQARPLLRDIVALLEFDRFGDAEAYRIGKQIESAIASWRPRELVELRFNTGWDSTSDPAIWIWAFLSDEKEDDFLNRAGELRPLLDAAARAAAPDRLPYVSFRSIAEQAELAEVGSP